MNGQPESRRDISNQSSPPDARDEFWPPARRRRIVLGIVLAGVVVAALASRRYTGVLPAFVVAHAGDTLWTVAAYLVAAIAFPRLPPWWLALWAFGISVTVELSQLSDAPLLNRLRELPGGRLVLGSGFLWIDLARYFVGTVVVTALDWLWWRHHKRRS